MILVKLAGHVKIFDELVQLGCAIDVLAHNSLLEALCKFCKKDKTDEAYQLLTEMIGRGTGPDTWSYNSILAYHCEHSDVNRALRLISRMQKIDCLSDRHTCNMSFRLLIGKGRLDRARVVGGYGRLRILSSSLNLCCHGSWIM
ncbi:pentatricopeptide repeat-containing protein mitochondrial [Gossypium australe]|uniref:Pentatricopeptide repeat-containing protein mitochondrial n=1 Tax=Gossypium australe TaxID=47621 RepID=A0A5B6X675_9ROSI|nr:pentatricopeptide repeat-containing protein mitochondrial [Gossypium australe]